MRFELLGSLCSCILNLEIHLAVVLVEKMC